jgi:SNF2 family DNA or RNA helicase
MTGDESKEDRYTLQKRFMETPEPQVIIGTSALEMSLNLQMARYMIQIDYIRNPKRMEQLYGRIRRIGSPYSNIVVIQLITSNTFEERIPQVLARREAVSDFMLGDDSSGFFAELNDEELRIILGF